MKFKTLWSSFLIFYISLSIVFVAQGLFTSITPNKLPPQRDDVAIVMQKGDLQQLNNLYKESPTEYMFCLFGEKRDKFWVIDNIERVEGNATETSFQITGDEEQCEESNHIGILHNHPKSPLFSSILQGYFFGYRNYLPSSEDIFFFGGILAGNEDKVVLQIIQFDDDEFYGMDFSDGLDFGSVPVLTSKN